MKGFLPAADQSIPNSLMTLHLFFFSINLAVFQASGGACQTKISLF